MFMIMYVLVLRTADKLHAVLGMYRYTCNEESWRLGVWVFGFDMT